MRILERLAKVGALVGAFGVASLLALQLHGGGLWDGLAPAIAADNAAATHAPAAYDLTQLKVVNEVLKTIRDRYVDPKRVKPKDMLLSALNYVQQDVAQVIVLHDEADARPGARCASTRRRRSSASTTCVGPWDVSCAPARGLRVPAGRPARHRGRPARGRVRRLQRHAPHARSALGAAVARGVQGDEPLDAGPVRRPRHRHLDPRSAAHRHEPHAGHAGGARGHQEVRPHRQDQQRVDAQHGPQRGREPPARRARHQGHRLDPPRRRRRLAGRASRSSSRARSIHVASVEHKLLDGGIGYVRLKQFQANTSTDLEAALADMKKNGELKGLVLDLRGNPGGLLDQAAQGRRQVPRRRAHRRHGRQPERGARGEGRARRGHRAELPDRACS